MERMNEWSEKAKQYTVEVPLAYSILGFSPGMYKMPEIAQAGGLRCFFSSLSTRTFFCSFLLTIRHCRASLFIISLFPSDPFVSSPCAAFLLSISELLAKLFYLFDSSL